MLFLQLPSEVAAQDLADLLPIDDTTALALERALLSTDESSRFRELSTALANNQNAASWALRTAETRLCRTINHVDEAAPWLCGHLETELADALTSDATDSAVNDIGWRLPLLATKLAETERRLSDFERRLEHEKLESLKELAYGASHEINNPLANIAARRKPFWKMKRLLSVNESCWPFIGRPCGHTK